MELVGEKNDHPRGMIQVFEDRFGEYSVIIKGDGYRGTKDVTQKVGSLGATPQQLLITAAQMWDEGMLD